MRQKYVKQAQDRLKWVNTDQKGVKKTKKGKKRSVKRFIFFKKGRKGLQIMEKCGRGVEKIRSGGKLSY